MVLWSNRGRVKQRSLNLITTQVVYFWILTWDYFHFCSLLCYTFLLFKILGSNTLSFPLFHATQGRINQDSRLAGPFAPGWWCSSVWGWCAPPDRGGKGRKPQGEQLRTWAQSQQTHLSDWLTKNSRQMSMSTTQSPHLPNRHNRLCLLLLMRTLLETLSAVLGT